MPPASTITNSCQYLVVGLFSDQAPDSPIWITIMIMRNDLRELLRHNAMYIEFTFFAIRTLQSY